MLPDELNGHPPGSEPGEAAGAAEHSDLRAFLPADSQEKSIRLTEDHIQSVLMVRRARSALLGPNLFSDPAWDILLELYAAWLGDRTVFPRDLSRATNTPNSTIYRWLTALEKQQLISVEGDPADASGVIVQLSATGAARMQRLADHWGTAFMSF